MRVFLALSILLVIPLSHAFLISVNEEQYEEQYGENLVKLYRQAEILWVRENKVILYDYLGHRNRPVSMLRDEQITAILKTEYSREASGINNIDISPYLERVRNRKIKLEPVTETVLGKREIDVPEKNPLLEEPKELRKKWSPEKSEKPPAVEMPACITRPFQESPLNIGGLYIIYSVAGLNC